MADERDDQTNDNEGATPTTGQQGGSQGSQPTVGSPGTELEFAL